MVGRCKKRVYYLYACARVNWSGLTFLRLLYVISTSVSLRTFYFILKHEVSLVRGLNSAIKEQSKVTA